MRLGIFIAFPPRTELHAEGLGRLLAEFVKAISVRSDLKLSIACPSWSRSSVVRLCQQEGISLDKLEIIAPRGRPFALKLYDSYETFRGRTSSFARLIAITQNATNAVIAHIEWLEQRIALARSWWVLVALLTYTALVGIIGGLFIVPVYAAHYLVTRLIRAASSITTRLSKAISRITPRRLVGQPIRSRLAHLVETNEISLIADLINKRPDIAAWYSPTAFWPQFNDIRKPRVVCVPDVVLADFPVSFAAFGQAGFTRRFDEIAKTILNASALVTYSEKVRTDTLIRRFNVSPEAVTVIPHAAATLEHWVSVAGDTTGELSLNHARQLLGQALKKSYYPGLATGFQNLGVRFIFYASQLRPHKNVRNLLLAYRHLLRTRRMGVKLFLTCNPEVIPEIGKFIRDERLEDDVFFLHGISSAELAACYKLAELAVNPTLCEGGCPFTFTEALSVGTPAVMSRIDVALEVLNDASLQDVMFFDPYDWCDMANRIEWALQNRDTLLTVQRPVYERLAQRTWSHVVDETIAVMDKVARQSSP